MFGDWGGGGGGCVWGCVWGGGWGSGCIICEETFYRTFGDKKRRRRPRGLKQLIQDPDINSPILWQLGAEIKMLVLLGTAGDSWLFSGLFAHWPWEQSSPVRMKCKDTNNVPAREREMGNEQFGLFAQQKGSHNGRPMAFPCIKPLSLRPPFVAWFLLPRPDKSPAALYF